MGSASGIHSNRCTSFNVRLVFTPFLPSIERPSYAAELTLFLSSFSGGQVIPPTEAVKKRKKSKSNKVVKWFHDFAEHERILPMQLL